MPPGRPLDIILIPAVAAMPRFEHRVIDVEPMVVVGSGPALGTPIELDEAGKEPFILVPDTCGLTTFTTRLFQSREMPLRTYPGEAASYSVLEEWTQLGLGSAMVPAPSSPRPTCLTGR
ncbi:LysR substrate-binding domain-containing protein [Streptosporangium lutulentum]